MTDTNAAISEYFAILRLEATPCTSVQRGVTVGVAIGFTVGAPHARMAASNGLTPTMFSTRVRFREFGRRIEHLWHQRRYRML